MKTKLRKLSGLPLVALAMASSGALAQSEAQSSGPGGSSTPASSSPSASIGQPGRSDLTFTLNARYDSNVPRLNDDQVNFRAFEKEDIRISPALQLGIARNLGRHQIGLRSTLGYDFYIRNSQLNRERLSVEPFALFDLPVCDVSLEALASRQQSDLGQLVLVGIDPTLGTNNSETRKRILGRVTCGDQYGLRPSLEIERSSGDNSNPFRQIANYTVTRIQPAVGYASPGLGEISVYAVKTDTDLSNQRLPGGGISGYSLRGVGVQYQRNIGSRLNFNGSVSHVDVTPYGGSLPGRSGLNASVALTLLVSDRLQFTAFANRNFTSTLTSTSTYELAEGYGLNANYAVNDRLRFRLGGQYSPREFFYGITPVGPFIGEQTQYDIFAGATYSLNRRMRLNLDAGYQKRDADLNIFDYESVYAGIGIAVSL